MKKKIYTPQQMLADTNKLRKEIYEYKIKYALTTLTMAAKDCIADKTKMNPDWVLSVARLEL